MKIKILNNLKLSLITLFLLIFFSSTSLSEQKTQFLCDNEILEYLIDNDDRNSEYNETRNDSGIHFDYAWNKKDKKIIIKRDQDNFPIIRYALFDNKNFIPNKTSIKKINNFDLSQLNDVDLTKLTYLAGENKYELDNGKTLKIFSKPYKFNNFKLSNFEIISIQNIDTTKGILEATFDAKLTNIRNDLNKVLKKSKFYSDRLINVCRDARGYDDWPLQTVEFDEFRYDADVREGFKNKEFIANPVFQITVDNNILKTLRTEKGVGFFRQSFDFRKFPFDEQKLIIRLNSGLKNLTNRNFDQSDPRPDVGSLTFISPEAGVYLNLSKFLNPEINKLKEWKIPENGIEVKSKILVGEEYNIYNNEIETISQNVLDIELTIVRNFQHYLLKIMLPVFLILCVAWYVLWIPTEKYEVRLNTSIIALLALIAYNFVFQDDIPKLEYLTAIDWFILLSYIFCCIPVFLSIAFSKFISKNQKKVMQINKMIKIWGGILYLVLTLQIFYNH